MARVSTKDWSAHEDAEALLSLSRALTDDEVEHVLTHWSPLARHNAGANGAFFTPMGLALDVAMMAVAGPGSRYLDLCAGTGRLTYWLHKMNERDSPAQKARTSYVCVELNPEFVEVGRRLMPWAEWVCGSAFDKDVIQPLGTFAVGVSNPPFGRVRSRDISKGWLNYTGVADLQACEVLSRVCERGAIVIMPCMSLPWDREGRKKTSEAYGRWAGAGQRCALVRTSLDASCYEFEGAKGVQYDIADLEPLDPGETHWTMQHGFGEGRQSKAKHMDALEERIAA